MLLKSNKVLLSFLAIVLLFTYTVPSNYAFAFEQDHSMSEIDISPEEAAEVEKVFTIIESLDESLDMENLSNNSESDINELDNEVQEFYYIYKEVSDQTDGEMTPESVLNVISLFLNKNQFGENNADIQVLSYNLVRSKDFYISNQRIRDVLALVGLHGTGWSFAIALAKKFGKSPTWVTLMIVAVPALGAATLNACNRQGKGVIITRLSIGATHQFSCKSQ